MVKHLESVFVCVRVCSVKAYRKQIEKVNEKYTSTYVTCRMLLQ